jgi:hypothetical protein
VPVNRLPVAFSSHQSTICFQASRQVILFSIKPSSTERQTHQLTTMAKSWLPKVKVAGKSNCTVISKRRERDGRTQSPQRSLRVESTNDPSPYKQQNHLTNTTIFSPTNSLQRLPHLHEHPRHPLQNPLPNPRSGLRPQQRRPRRLPRNPHPRLSPLARHLRPDRQPLFILPPRLSKHIHQRTRNRRYQAILRRE